MTRRNWQAFTASLGLYSTAFIFTKLSILLLLKQIFWARRSAVVLIWIGIVVNTLFYSISGILSLVWCAPRPGRDTMTSVSSTSCQKDAYHLQIVQSGFNIGSDLYLLLIPIPLLFQLEMPLGRKLRISFVFTLGLV
jgi:hypothetical protein